MQTCKMNQTARMRWFLIIPFTLLLGSLIVGTMSYKTAKVHLNEDLNEAMIHLASSKSALFASPDTIKALRHMKQTVNQPIIYKATGLETCNDLLKESTFFQLALLEESDNNGKNGKTQRVGRLAAKKTLADKSIVSDSIVIIPQGLTEGIAIEVTGYIECNMASIFFTSDQRLSLTLFILSLVTFTLIFFRKGRLWDEAELYEHLRYEQLYQVGAPVANTQEDENEDSLNSSYSNYMTQNAVKALDLGQYKLTPMQKRLMERMLHAEDYRVGKFDLCDALWDGKSNAEESLYTLIRRTKQALKGSGIEIICNRGESYELRINH